MHLAVLVAVFVLTGCGALSQTLRAEVTAPADPPLMELAPWLEEAADAAVLRCVAPDAVEPAALAVPADVSVTAPASPPPAPTAGAAASRVTAQSRPADRAEEGDGELDQYDPWERFNEKMFNFNLRVDRYVLKPVARAYRAVVPEDVQIMISNGLDNIRFVPRLVNNLLQAKWAGAASEFTRFVLNSTLGFGGLFDVGKHAGIERSGEDFGQTLGTWGMAPGPYLILPLLEPMTVRDGIGRGVDLFMDPLGYYVPFLPERLAMRLEDTINDRALNYELFQGVEETTLDLYSSVRHFYLNRREKQVRE
jgi:phospholipid-binding lipoprotein MlaA